MTYANLKIIHFKTTDQEAEIPEEMPAQFAKLIKRCWEKKRGDRPEVEAVLQQLRRCQP